MFHIKSSSDLSSGRRPKSKSDDFLVWNIVGTEIWPPLLFYFCRKGLPFIGASLPAPNSGTPDTMGSSPRAGDDTGTRGWARRARASFHSVGGCCFLWASQSAGWEAHALCA